jgi:hypothetical protein
MTSNRLYDVAAFAIAIVAFVVFLFSVGYGAGQRAERKKARDAGVCRTIDNGSGAFEYEYGCRRDHVDDE